MGVAQTKSIPVIAKDNRSMLDELPSGLIGLHDRAQLTLGFAGGFRRSELVALNCDDLVFVAEGLELDRAAARDHREPLVRVHRGESPRPCAPNRDLFEGAVPTPSGSGRVFSTAIRSAV
jgi:hypothetical protein